MPPPDMPPPAMPSSEARSSVDAASWRWLLGSGGVLLLLLVAIAALAQEPSTLEPTVSDVAPPTDADVAAGPTPSPSPSPSPTPRPSPPASPPPSPSPPEEPSPDATPRAQDAGPVLAASPRVDDAPVLVQGRVDRVVDGDTFELSNGTRVRLAITDTPEIHNGMETCGPEAASFATDFLAGETVAVYRPADAPETDNYGRTLGEAVRVSDGASLNVALVAAGLGRIDDRFTDEDADLTARLRAASATAEPPTCEDHSQPEPEPEPASEPEPEPEPEPQPATDASSQHGGRTNGGWECHPAYHECLPQTDDLNCGDVGHSVTVLDPNRDPYGLDGNDHDGKGCESEGPWSSSVTYPYY